MDVQTDQEKYKKFQLEEEDAVVVYGGDLFLSYDYITVDGILSQKYRRGEPTLIGGLMFQMKRLDDTGPNFSTESYGDDNHNFFDLSISEEMEEVRKSK
jgi:hypothetical protein